MNKNSNLINVLIFQATWWGILLLKSNGNEALLYFWGALGVFLQAAALGISRISRVIVWSAIALVGWGLDLALSLTPILSFHAGDETLWLLFVWIIFVSTLNHSLAYFRSRRLLAFLGGAVFGPASYAVAGAWNVLVYTHEPLWLAAHGFFWGVLFIAALEITHYGENKW